ncbi:MAG: hypothetical protein ACYDCO_13670 [Armatimonadota bacterium]
MVLCPLCQSQPRPNCEFCRRKRAEAQLQRHFQLMHEMEECYKQRDTISGSYQRAINLCQRMIEIAPQMAAAFLQAYKSLPGHPGYKQLSIIMEKAGEFDRAIQLCRVAQLQGWMGDWEKRIARCQRKKSKADKLDIQLSDV